MARSPELQTTLNRQHSLWGHGSGSLDYSTWDLAPHLVTRGMVIEAGIGHACRVIQPVLSRGRSDYDNWLSYRLKHDGYVVFAGLLERNRPDLHAQWQKSRSRHRREKTHWDLRGIIQLPHQSNPHHIEAVARLPQNYLSLLYRNFQVAQHGLRPDLASTPADQEKFTFFATNFQSCADNAKSIHHFCCLVAVKAATMLRQSGVDDQKVTSLLVSSFAIPALIREYGCQKEAESIVDGIIREFTATGKAAGLAKLFREQARPLVRQHYYGQANPHLSKSSSRR